MNLSKRLLLIPFFLIHLLYATNDGSPIGGRRIGMGGAYSSVRGDMWSLWANPAGMTGMSRFEGGLFSESRFLISELSTASFGAVIPFQQKHFAGVSATTFGFGSYRRNEAGLAYATTLYDVIHLGVKFNVLNLAIANYGSVNTFLANVGVMADVSKKFTVGFWTQNVNQARIGVLQEERLSTILNGGATFKASDKLILTGDVVKFLDYPMGVRSGFEYFFVKQFCIRAGYSTSPSVLNGGAGFRLDNISVDFANSYHERLGYSPHLSITIRLGQKAEPVPSTKTQTSEKPAPAPVQNKVKEEVKPGPVGPDKKPIPLQEKKVEPVSPEKKTGTTGTSPAPAKPKPVLPVTATPQEIKAAKKAAQQPSSKPENSAPGQPK